MMHPIWNSKTIHAALYPIPQTVYANYLERGWLSAHKDGMNSRVHTIVRESHNGPVLKVTCCEATQVLFGLINPDGRFRSPIFGLPHVFGKFGVCATDSDSFTYSGYFVERLREPQSTAEHQKVDDLLNAFRRYHDMFSRDYPGNTNSCLAQRTAIALAQDDIFGLGRAFSLVAEAIHKTGAILDLDQPGNVLFTASGRICLSDPVAQSFSFN